MVIVNLLDLPTSGQQKTYLRLMMCAYVGVTVCVRVCVCVHVACECMRACVHMAQLLASNSMPKSSLRNPGSTS